MVCGLLCKAFPLLSLADSVICPLYVPGARFAGLTLTLTVLPVVGPRFIEGPLSVLVVEESTSHVLLPVSPTAFHETGCVQSPVSLKVKFCAGGAACPCATVKESAGGGDDTCSTQGSETVSVTENVCGLACACVPELSVAVTET